MRHTVDILSMGYSAGYGCCSAGVPTDGSDNSS